MNGTAAAGKASQQQAAGNHPGKPEPSHWNFLNHQVSFFRWLDLTGSSAVFWKFDIIGEARLQSQATLQRNLALGRRNRNR
jgi:hypothetical protein